MPKEFNVRSRVHEYGGGAWTISGGVLYFSNDSDQRLYRLDAGSPTPVPIAYAHLELAAGSRFQHPLPQGWVAAVAVLHGEILIEDRPVPADHVGLLSADGEGIELTSKTGASLMLLAGQPLREPIAHHGPFVMNTREELEQAFADYAAGRMGRL